MLGLDARAYVLGVLGSRTQRKNCGRGGRGNLHSVVLEFFFGIFFSLDFLGLFLFLRPSPIFNECGRSLRMCIIKGVTELMSVDVYMRTGGNITHRALKIAIERSIYTTACPSTKEGWNIIPTLQRDF